MERKILIVEDEATQRRLLARAINSPDRFIQQAANAAEALDLLGMESFHVVVTDIAMPGIDGIELFRRIKTRYPSTLVIVITAYGTIKSAVEALKLGAEDYITKPFNKDEINIAIEKALEKWELMAEVNILREELLEKYGMANIISKNHKMHDIFQLVQTVAPTDSTVLILGDTGTGKELIARAIHINSPRVSRPFVPINCGSLPHELLESELFGHEKGAFTGAIAQRLGKFEYANGGTIFLDEIGNMSPGIQAKLLRVLEDSTFQRIGGNKFIKVNVRFISATNSNLEDKVKENSFREDLYYRINVVPIKIPPLRERKEDIPLLAGHFLKTYREKMKKNIMEISNEVLERLMTYHWPGNVRQLENLMERAVVTTNGKIITNIDLPPLDNPAKKMKYNEVDLIDKGMREKLDQIERGYITQLLEKFSGNAEQTAAYARISIRTLQRKMRQYGIKAGKFRPRP